MLLTEFDFEGTPLVFWKAPNGKPVVTAASMVQALKGDKNNAAAITRNSVRSKWLISLPTPSGGRDTLCIFEPGAYQLAGNPLFQTEIAERFQDWLYEEVLPKLRAEGIVITANAAQQSIDSAVQEWKDSFLSKFHESTGILIKVRDLGLGYIQELKPNDPSIKVLTANVRMIERSLATHYERFLKIQERSQKQLTPKSSVQKQLTPKSSVQKQPKPLISLTDVENFANNREQFLDKELVSAFPKITDLHQCMMLLRSINYIPTSTIINGVRFRVWVRSPYKS